MNGSGTLATIARDLLQEEMNGFHVPAKNCFRLALSFNWPDTKSEVGAEHRERTQHQNHHRTNETVKVI